MIDESILNKLIRFFTNASWSSTRVSSVYVNGYLLQASAFGASFGTKGYLGSSDFDNLCYWAKVSSFEVLTYQPLDHWTVDTGLDGSAALNTRCRNLAGYLEPPSSRMVKLTFNARFVSGLADTLAVRRFRWIVRYHVWLSRADLYDLCYELGSRWTTLWRSNPWLLELGRHDLDRALSSTPGELWFDVLSRTNSSRFLHECCVDVLRVSSV